MEQMFDAYARPPLAADEARWSDLVDYTACQALADAARGAEVGLLRYQSVRDPARGANLAILSAVRSPGWRRCRARPGRSALEETGFRRSAIFL